MASYFLDRLKKRRGTDLYGGRSPLDEIIYGFDTTVDSNKGGIAPVLQDSFMQGSYRENPNFSALNLSNAQKQKIRNDSYLRNNLIPPNWMASNRQPGIGIANQRTSGFTPKKPETSTPNLSNNLLFNTYTYSSYTVKNDG